jgi:hypothetical protein
MKYLFISIIILSGCSTQTKSKMYGAITGGLICGTLGAYLGYELSPDSESEDYNTVLGSGIGAGVCGIGGYFLGSHLYQSDPRNKEYEPLKFENKKKESSQELINNELEDISLKDLSLTQKEYAQIPLIKGLPKSLKNKVKKQKIIKYKIKPQMIKTKDGRDLYFSGGEAIEHQYAQ